MTEPPPSSQRTGCACTWGVWGEGIEQHWPPPVFRSVRCGDEEQGQSRGLRCHAVPALNPGAPRQAECKEKKARRDKT